MTVAVRLSNDKTLVPVRLAAGESVRESATVHAASGFVVLEAGTTGFTVAGPARTETTRTLLRFERIAAVVELPAIVGTEQQMARLRARWENVDAFYRRVEDSNRTTHTPETVYDLAQMRILGVDTDDIPATAAGWTPAPDYLGILSPLSALVPGTLSGVPDLVAGQLDIPGVRVQVRKPTWSATETTLIADFSVPFADARTKLVKKDPLNNRRNAKRIPVPDTKYVQLSEQVPVVLTAQTLAQAHEQVEQIVQNIRARIAEPAAVCNHCAGAGLVLANGVRERH
ncbi:hypothetical protein [Mycolicibacterium austroafricanum]|uniref:hypothetical protein n=1 Tax=Mycolicibacterium austroafricanum TaxID=39687 RepID=UPI00055D32A0|nr:hypothetical protein [Mycolicibacterium austroafricanum]